MSVAIENMIAALEPRHTVPGIFAGRFSGRRKTAVRQPVACAFGDFSSVDPAFDLVCENLSEALEPGADERVLHLAAASDGVQWAEKDGLPFAKNAFDVVSSAFSMTFAADHRRAARELLRVCRPGGRIGLACWSPHGFIGQLISTIRRYVPGESQFNGRILWGTRRYLNELFGDSADALGAATRTHAWRYRSPQHWLDSWRSVGGPLQRAFDSVDPDWRQQLSAELLALAARYSEADDGSMFVQSEYLEFVVHKSTWRN